MSWWIMAAYTYEELNKPIISDQLFDTIGLLLNELWDKINHPHKGLLDRKFLKSSLAIGGKYPLMAMHAAESLILHGIDGPPIPKEETPDVGYTKPEQLSLF